MGIHGFPGAGGTARPVPGEPLPRATLYDLSSELLEPQGKPGWGIIFHSLFNGCAWFSHACSLFLHCLFQRTGFQRTGNPSVFIDGHPSMNSLMDHQ